MKLSIYFLQDICSKVAEKFHNKVLLKNAFHGWHGTIKKKWKNRMMKACRVKADTTVNDLVAEYEAKLDEVCCYLKKNSGDYILSK